MPNRTDELSRLMQRYRRLCEATGIARANGIPMATAAQSTLADLERSILSFAEPAAPMPTCPSPTAPAKPITLASADAERQSLVSRPARSVDSSLTLAATDSAAKVAAASGSANTSAIVYTDGSAEGNPGPGGYCALVRMPDRPDRELSGGTIHTTNNKMELTAAIVGLGTAIDAGATDVTVYSDSEYVIKGITEWLPGWKRKNWQTANGQPVKNRELWEQLARLVEGRPVRWHWVKGHAGHPENERCDQVATAAARRAAKSPSA